MGLEPAQPSDINTAPGRSLDQGRPLVFGGNRAPAAAEPHPHTAFGSSTGQDLTMALGGITGHSHQAAPHHPQGSSPASPPCACILLLLLLSHLSIYLLIVVAPLGSSQECNVLPRQGTCWVWSAHLGPVVLDWGSSQSCSHLLYFPTLSFLMIFQFLH